MYQKKHLATREKRALPKKKWSLLLVSMLLIAAVAVGSTVAYIVTSTNALENVFNPTKITVDVDEKFENGVKSDVTIQNTGTTDAYIRAQIIVTWKDANGNVAATKPVLGTDYTYTMELNLTDNGWFQGSDGFYYFSKSVAPNDKTGVLITECKKMNGATVPEGYDLSVEIIASGIQSTPDNVVQEAWRVVTGSSGKLAPASSN